MQTIEMTMPAQLPPDNAAGRPKPSTAFWSRATGIAAAILFAAGVWYGNNYPEVAEQLDRQIVQTIINTSKIKN